RRPLRRPEARLSGLGQRPDTERLATGDLLAVVIVAALTFQRRPKRVDVELATGGRIGRDHRHGREELDVHATPRSRCARSTIQACSATRAFEASDRAAAGNLRRSESGSVDLVLDVSDAWRVD